MTGVQTCALPIWSIGDLINVDWNITQSKKPFDENSTCLALNGCVKYSLSIPVASPTADSRTYRNNLIGYSGTTYANWEDFRIIVDAGTVDEAILSPDAAHQAGYIYNLKIGRASCRERV